MVGKGQMHSIGGYFEEQRASGGHGTGHLARRLARRGRGGG